MKKNTIIKTLAVTLCAGMVAATGTVALADSSYAVKKGDSLWKIAKEMLGDGARYNEIFDANRDKIKNPNLIYVGQELVIPDGKTAPETPQQETNVPQAETTNTPQAESTNIPGRYVRVYSEEIEGQNVECTDIVELREDHTCMVDFQDTVVGKWDGNKLILDSGSEYEFKIEDGNLVLNTTGTWDTYYREEESNIKPPVLAAEEQYASIISELKPGQAYAFADICPSCDVLLVSEDGAYDFDRKGTMAAINAKIYAPDKDGKIIEYGTAFSSSTAAPLAVYDGNLMSCTHNRVMMEFIDDKTGSMTTKKCAEMVYDENGNVSYGYMDYDTRTDGSVDDDSKMKEMYEMYDKATIINFTVVK